jgi:hypothetical protein
VCLYNPGDEIKALPWAILTTLLLTSAWGLRRRSAWARGLTLVIHWPVFVVALGLCLCMLVFWRGITIENFLTDAPLRIGFFHLLPVLLVSGYTLWRFQGRFAGKPQVHHIVAIVYVVAAIMLAVAIVGLYNPRDQIEALPWVLLMILPLAMVRGLWRQAAWARGLALVIHWPVFVVALGLCLCIFRGIAVAPFFAIFLVIDLLPLLLVYGGTLWLLHRQKVREDNLLRELGPKEDEN